jgi:hypothetical protein
MPVKAPPPADEVLAVHELASVEDHASATVCPRLIVIALADNCAVGGAAGLELLLPPPHPATPIARVAQQAKIIA